MKRLHLLSLFLLGLFTWVPVASAQSQNVSSRVAAPQILTAVDDTAFTLVNVPVDIDVLANDVETNVGLEIVLVKVLQSPWHASALKIERGDPRVPEDDYITYTPENGFVGKDSLLYEIGNSIQVLDSAWVFIYVNQSPTAAPDTVQVLPNVTSDLDVLANDTDPDGDPLQLEAISVPPASGVAVITGGMPPMVRYTPNAGFVGRDSLKYIMSDGKQALDSAWVFLAVNTPPTAEDDSVTTLPDTPVDVSVLDNDTDVEDHALTVAGIPTGPANGTAVINGDMVTYTPNAGFSGVDSFVYSVVDELGGEDVAIVTVTINTPPSAVDDEASTIFEMPVTVDVLANDTDADGDALTLVAIDDPPANGTAVIDGAAIMYTPDADFFGTDSLTYSITDTFGGMDQATVTISVLADAAVQFIQNALPAEPIDVYVNDERVLNDFNFRTATPYMNLSAGEARIDITVGSAADNSNPFFSTTLDLTPMEAYVAVADGLIGENFDLLIKEGAHPVAAGTNAEFFVVHGVLDAPASGIDLRLLNPFSNNVPLQVLVDDLNFEESSDYVTLNPSLYNVEATNFDESMSYGIYSFDLSSMQQKTFTVVLSGLLMPAAGETAFAIVGYDAQGNMLPLATSAEDVAELPETFTLRGNFPNPFNPTTTLQFDLPEAAAVTVELVDMLGRVVLVLPEKQVAAGANRRMEVDASRLASGVYFYRVLARTATDLMIRTGRMMLVK